MRIRRLSLNQIQLEAPSISFFLNKNPGIYNFLCVTTPQTRRGETQICVKKLVSPERLLDKRGSKMKVCFGLKSPREEFVASVALWCKFEFGALFNWKMGLLKSFESHIRFSDTKLFGFDMNFPLLCSLIFHNLNQQASLGCYYKFGWEQIPARQIVSFFTRLEMLAD